MGRHKVKLDRGDRVRRPSEAEASATLVDDHKDGGYSVLPDEGPKRLKHWEDAVKVSGPVRKCPRCGSQEHTVYYCKEDL